MAEMKQFGIDLELDDAHDAGADVTATLDIVRVCAARMRNITEEFCTGGLNDQVSDRRGTGIEPRFVGRGFVLRCSREAILSWDGGILLLLLFFSGFPGVLDVSSAASSSSLMRSLATASSVFRLCISTSFWLMTRLRRPISSVFSESDFSSLRRRWFIWRKTTSRLQRAVNNCYTTVYCSYFTG